ncbi:MAG: iron-sulfur cluster-binding protein [Planctomycetota bacterium]|nr:MAG: iron-sulfur cluster-binding protein [Planctomycetota bacterium]
MNTATTDHDAKPNFKQSVARVLADPSVSEIFTRATDRKDTARLAALADLDDPLGVRNLAAQIKNHTLQNLDRYLKQLVDKVRKLGGHVHFARTGEQAKEIMVGIAREAGVKNIVKAKSMVSEEIELNDELIGAGFDVVETDLGEFILQLANEKPSHIVTPVAHKLKEDIAELFKEKLGIEYTTDPPTLTAAARKYLRAKFKAADMGITGVNFAVAETGTICIVTNEGNGRMCTSRPKVLVSLMGIEKVVPRMKDLAVLLKLLGKSATGQRMTCYTSLFNGPKQADDLDGPEEFHLVIMDRGRTDILSKLEYRYILRCIRCGACLNTCPVYKIIGGHAYQSVYPGPIGTMLTPLFNSFEEYQDLPLACSLCGACYDACPVRMDIPTTLIQMRNELLKQGYVPFLYRMGFKGWRIGMLSKFLYRWGSRMARIFMKPITRKGWIRWLPSMASGWTDHRDLPAMARKPFHRQWKKLLKEIETEEQH